MSLTFPLDDNGDVLRQLQARGDDLSIPRDIDFSVVFATEANAKAFAILSGAPDTRVSVDRPEVATALPWDVTVTRHMLPDHGAIGEFEDTLAHRALPLGGRNDGWGCFGQPPVPASD